MIILFFLQVMVNSNCTVYNMERFSAPQDTLRILYPLNGYPYNYRIIFSFYFQLSCCHGYLFASHSNGITGYPLVVTSPLSLAMAAGKKEKESSINYKVMKQSKCINYNYYQPVEWRQWSFNWQGRPTFFHSLNMNNIIRMCLAYVRC